MKTDYIIIFPKQVSTETYVHPVTDMLSIIGVTSISGSLNKKQQFALRFTTESPINTIQGKIIRSFLKEASPSYEIRFTHHDPEFDFEDYIETDLDGARQEIDFHELLHETEKLIKKVIPEDQRMQGKARNAVAVLFRHSLTEWLAGKLF
jgi:hypothetical protein